jgi:cytochrome c oxidase subunit III
MPDKFRAELGGGLRPGNAVGIACGAAAPQRAPESPQRTYVIGMVIAMGAIVMFFIALVSAFVVRKGFPNSDWQSLELPRVLWLNTLILLASSATLAGARKNLVARREDAFRHWWGVTAILGLFFLAGQVIAWRQLAAAGVFLATNPSGSFFYVFTVAHGLHLLAGIAALLTVAIRPSRHLTRGTATEIVAIYWHFMDALWVGLFLLLTFGR